MENSYDDLHEISTYKEHTKTSIKYIAEIRHKGLKTYRVIRDINKYIRDSKVDAQFEIWDDKWAKIKQKTKKEQEKNASFDLAIEKTNDAKKRFRILTISYLILLKLIA